MAFERALATSPREAVVFCGRFAMRRKGRCEGPVSDSSRTGSGPEVVAPTGRSLARQFGCYTAVGAVSTFVDGGVLYALAVGCGLHYQLAGVVGFLAGLLLNYLLSRAWVFRRGRYGARLEFALFAATGVAGVALNAGALWLGVSALGAPLLTAKAAAVALTLVWNFETRRRFVFAQQAPPHA